MSNNELHRNREDNRSGAALLVIDIQNDYFPGGEYALTGSMEASLQAQKILAFFRSRQLPVIHIEHESVKPDATFFLPGTEGQRIHEHVLPLPGELVIKKHIVSSFEQTSLLEYLQEQKIQQLVITGMQTNVCVLGATKDALKYNFDVIVVKDAVAAVDAATHTDTLTGIEAKGATLITTEELLTTFAEQR